MFWWGEEDREVVNHLKECGEHLLIVLAWLFSIKVTLAADEFLFGTPNAIVTLVIWFEELAIVLTIVKYGIKMLKWFYRSIRTDIKECETDLPIPN